MLLLPLGVTGLWAGAFHVIFPATAARFIGWDTSPFQLEVGMADLAIGATACIAFWRNLSFNATAVSAASIFLLGDADGLQRAATCVEQGQGSNPLDSWRFRDARQTGAVAGIGGISILDLIGQRPKTRGRRD
jgi:hypothetical protein